LGVTIEAAVQAMLGGMPSPLDLHRAEVDGEVLIAVGSTVLFRQGYPSEPTRLV